MLKYLMIFFVSMVPLIELRGGVPIAELLAENIGQIFCIWVSTLVGNFIGCNASNKRPYLAQN